LFSTIEFSAIFVDEAKNKKKKNFKVALRMPQYSQQELKKFAKSLAKDFRVKFETIKKIGKDTETQNYSPSKISKLCRIRDVLMGNEHELTTFFSLNINSATIIFASLRGYSGELSSLFLQLFEAVSAELKCAQHRQAAEPKKARGLDWTNKELKKRMQEPFLIPFAVTSISKIKNFFFFVTHLRTQRREDYPSSSLVPH